MSNIFYKYLSEKILDYFRNKTLNPGDKYNIQFEQLKDVADLVVHLEDLAKQEGIIETFIWDEKSFSTFSIIFEGCKIIISSTVDKVTPDFLTTLRNMVGTEDPLFKKTAILFIHDTTLDSIIGGTESLQKKGMPLSFKALKDNIAQKIQSSSLNETEKSIVAFSLKKIESQNTDAASIFDYQPIIKTLYGQIDDETFKEFRLFKDKGLDQIYDERSRLERLEENYEKFILIEEIQKYGDPAQELEKHFDEKGVEKLTQENWSDQDYAFVKESADIAKKVTPLAYIENTPKTTAEGLTYWERSDGDTKAKERKRNIIIFNKNHTDTVTIDFHFDRYLKKEHFTNQFNQSASISGKKITMTIECEEGTTTFSKFRYKEDGVNYEFKVAVVECSEDYLLAVSTNYLVQISKKEQYIEIADLKENIILNQGGREEETVVLKDEQSVINHEDIDKQLVIVKNIEENSNDNNLLQVLIKLPSTEIPFAISEEIPKITSITGLKVQKDKRDYKQSFQYADERLLHGNRAYYINDNLFEENLKIEQAFIKNAALYMKEINGKVERDELKIPADIKESYLNIINYFQRNNTLPSLSYWDEELTRLAEVYVQSVLKFINNIKEGHILDTNEKNLMKLGTVEVLGGLKEIKFTPLHPINVAYQIELNKQVGEESLPDEILKRLDSKDLLPYIYHNNEIYKPVEQKHSPEWTYYYQYQTSRYNASVNFVSKLVSEKIKEFTSHFDYLFQAHSQAPLKLNLINLGDCREVLQGIFEYYNKNLKNVKSLKDLLPIQLYIYGEENSYNSFEEFSFYEDPEEIKKHFQINLNSKDFSQEDILNIFREKVHFFKRKLDEETYEYAHITFYEVNQNTDETRDDMRNIETGIGLNGLLSSVTSVFLGNSYRTGFGTKYLYESPSDLVELSMSFNALAQAASKQNPFNQFETIVTAFSERDDSQLNKIYKSSHWVTFIEPKFDLSFFRYNEERDNNLMIIHYSDQYSSSSSYDAITVTERSTQYQTIINEFLADKLTNEDSFETSKIINLFNSINGDWLLRLISNNSQFPREKLSLLSAVKFSLAYFAHPDIHWVPLSLEEIFRVSGAVGLKQKEGLFSASNLGVSGSQSDDLLLIGIEEKGDTIKVHYYPVEVKIGYNKDGVIKKATEQVNKTRKALEDFLASQSFRGKVYRDFLIQLALVSAKKMQLYNVWPEQDWKKILDTGIRTKLLNDQYKVEFGLNKYIKDGAIISFGKDINFKTVKPIENTLLIELPEYDGFQYITKDIPYLMETIQGSRTDLKTEILLCNNYNVETHVEENKGNTATEEETKDLEDVTELEKETEKEIEKEIDSTTSSHSASQDRQMEILFGHRIADKTPLIWYPTTTSKVMHTNTGIIGTMGTGKTQFTKSLITQLHNSFEKNVNRTNIGILIFDYKGDYIKDDFVKANDATVYDLFHLPYNPLALFKGEQPKPMLPLHTANSIKETIGTAFNLGVKQKGLLRDLIMEAYERKGIHRAKSETWDLFAPTIADVYNIYLEKEGSKEDSLSVALKDLAEFEIFSPVSEETKSLYELIDGVTVINLSNYDVGIQNLIVGITLDAFYSQMQTKGHSQITGDYRELTKMILVDEADNFLSRDFASLKKILKEGREFGVGTILSTQFLSHFATGENDYSQYILTWVVHQVTEIKRREVQSIFNTESKEEEERLMNKIRALEKHQSLATNVSGNKLEFMEDMAFWRLLKED
ncbi:DNA phosphorothioation-dependent restriction protein DptH [Halalkalibacter urbisdiaboli]|uniref:DNA phosphorothioation-dependent restriction protein DptH n=1 Tax=Halalkalibacter urbisdiaboli TaxID=1960589 RepID=UPI0013FE37D2|nr:DNA phosphorothioation-dependent restriction protein DptH [Halalkalibacter urbisdiaboli]